MDEGGIAVTMDGPVFLGTLEVEFFVLGKEHVMLLGKMELELIILLVGEPLFAVGESGPQQPLASRLVWV